MIIIDNINLSMKYYYPLVMMCWMVLPINAQARNVTAVSLTVTPADTVQAVLADTATSFKKHHWNDIAYSRVQMGCNQETWNTHGGVSRPLDMGGFNVGIALGLANEDVPIVLEVVPSVSFDFHREKDNQGRLSQKNYYSALTLPLNLVFRFPLHSEKGWSLLPFVGIHGTYGFKGWDKYYDSTGHQILQNNWFKEADNDDNDDDYYYFFDMDMSKKRAHPANEVAKRMTKSEEEESISCLDGQRFQFGVQWGLGVRLGAYYVGYQWEENLTHIWSHTKMRTYSISIGYYFAENGL